MPVELVIHEAPLPYAAQLDARAADSIDLIVIHCTELPDLAQAREYGERILYPESGTGNSGHYYIDRDGAVYRYVDELRIAHHVRGFNPRSIGIELVNRGRYPDWLNSTRQVPDETYGAAQIEALLALIGYLSNAFPTLKHIAGHEQLDRSEEIASDDASRTVRRKIDPGPLFPWDRVLSAVKLQRL